MLDAMLSVRCGVSSHPGARTLAPTPAQHTATLLLVLLAAVLFLLTYAPPCASMCRLCRARTDANTQPHIARPSSGQSMARKYFTCLQNISLFILSKYTLTYVP